jgi:hypothetical protein
MTTTPNTGAAGYLELPTIPQDLIDRISRYGFARTDGLTEPDRLYLWRQVIDGIKDYAASVLADRASRAGGAVITSQDFESIWNDAVGDYGHVAGLYKDKMVAGLNRLLAAPLPVEEASEKAGPNTYHAGDLDPAARVYLAEDVDGRWTPRQLAAADADAEDAAKWFMGGAPSPNAVQAAPAVDPVREALRLAIRQNSHDMLMTGEEIRQCEAALSTTKE